MKLFNNIFVKITVVMLLLPYIYACSSSDSDNDITIPVNVNWNTSSTVKSSSGVSSMIITGAVGTKWNAEIIEGSSWCSFDVNDYSVSQKSGEINGSLNVLYVYYKSNSNAKRTAKISFSVDGQEIEVLNLTQLSESEEDLPEFNAWAEIPSYKENVNYQYVTHYVAVNNKSARNYSICFDKTKKAALWVAYPIHQAYFGSSGRTDAWSFDPSILSQFQANCVSKSYKGNYDRGHQIASADRTASDEMNAQTFYMSNMTPQLDRLNQDMWAKLEGKVRTYSCLDTLYVVTGAYFGNNALTTTDGAGNTVPIPTNYFKVLLRTNRGNSGKNIKDCSDSELRTIGFWVEQRSYGNIQPPTEICTSVEDIESKTGFTFFPQVSSTVKKQNNPSVWGL